jgi:Holliday junction resolvase RusA-like endonuclease
MIEFTIPGNPVGKGRPRFARRGKHVATYTPEQTASYENLVRLYASKAMAGSLILTGPVAVFIHAGMLIPSGYSQKKRAQALANIITPTKKPDADNILKIVCDSINGIVWNDDKQVVHAVVRKVFAETPYVHVMVENHEIPK